MEFVKIKIHPLFFLFGIFSAVTGELAPFLICTLTALLHECGHIFYAEKMGYDCKNIKLMPYGASAVCDIDTISAKDEIFLAIAGPLVNLFICIGCAGLWWFFPESYAYTDTVFDANVAMLYLNLLPAYPLDGGRVLNRLIKKFAGEKAAKWVLKGMGVALAATFVVLFFTIEKNFSLLFLAGFLLCSAFERQSPACKIRFASKKILKRGVEVKYVMCNGEITFRQALRHLDSSRYLVLQIYSGDFLEEVTEEELLQKLQTANVYDKIICGSQ